MFGTVSMEIETLPSTTTTFNLFQPAVTQCRCTTVQRSTVYEWWFLNKHYIIANRHYDHCNLLLLKKKRYLKPGSHYAIKTIAKSIKLMSCYVNNCYRTVWTNRDNTLDEYLATIAQWEPGLNGVNCWPQSRSKIDERFPKRYYSSKNGLLQHPF